MSKQHDELEAPAAMEKRLGITAKTERAASRYSDSKSARYFWCCTEQTISHMSFLAGVRWERRRRNKDGY